MVLWSQVTKAARKCRENGMRRKKNGESDGDRNVARSRMFASKRLCKGCFSLCPASLFSCNLTIPLQHTKYSHSIEHAEQRRWAAPAGDLKNSDESKEFCGKIEGQKFT